MMRDLLLHLVKPIVAHPDEINVQVIEGEASVVVEMTVNAEDRAAIEGPEGRTLRALRSVRMDFPSIAELLSKNGRRALYLVTREVEDRQARLHARIAFDRPQRGTLAIVRQFTLLHKHRPAQDGIQGSSQLVR